MTCGRSHPGGPAPPWPNALRLADTEPDLTAPKPALAVLSSTLGPLLTILIFHFNGDEWTLPILRDTFLAGLALELLPGLCMLAFKVALARAISAD